MYINESQDDDGIRSIALRLLIHYIGDIHQPFHTYEGYSQEFPLGDHGGNNYDFELVSTPGDTSTLYYKSIHSAWDSLMGE